MNMIVSSEQNSLVRRINLVYIFWVITLIAYSSNNVLGSVALLASLPFLLFYLLKGVNNKMFFWTLAIIIAFSAVYGLISYYYGLLTPLSFIRQVYYPFALFMLGNLLVRKDYSYKKTYTFLFSIIAGSSLYGALSLYNATYRLGIPAEFRTAVDIWNGAQIAATGLNSYVSLGLCLLPIIFLSSKKEKNIKWRFISLLAFIASAFATIQLANRTGILIVVASVILVAVLSKKTKSFMRNSVVSILLIGLGAVIYITDTFGVKSWWENSLVYSRFLESSLGDDPRFEAWSLAITGLFDHPMGGRLTDVGIYYAHNTWLDIGVDGGVISLVLFGVFTLTSIVILYQFLKIKHPPTLKVLIISIHAGFFITFLFEPVMQGLMDYFTFYCFLVGVLLRINIDKINSLKSSTTNFD